MVRQSKLVNSDNVLDYIDAIAEIHHLAYDDGHFTSLFSLGVLKNYYLELISYSDVTIVVIDDNRVVGFLISGQHVSKGIASFIKHKRFYLANILLRNPRFLFQKLVTTFYSKLFSSTPTKASFRLLSIAVSSQIQSNGAGAFLLAELEALLKRENIAEYGLSVRLSNIRALNFYIKNGFVLEKSSNGTCYMIKGLA